MPLTNPWDPTQPPDTQLAKLLGQDIRSLKQDISDRLTAVGFGTAAAQMNLDLGFFGSAGSGILYLTTDTRRAYQWNGSTWVEVPSWEIVTTRMMSVALPGNSYNSINVTHSRALADANYTIMGITLFDPTAGGTLNKYTNVCNVSVKTATYLTVNILNLDNNPHTVNIEVAVIHD